MCPHHFKNAAEFVCVNMGSFLPDANGSHNGRWHGVGVCHTMSCLARWQGGWIAYASCTKTYMGSPGSSGTTTGRQWGSGVWTAPDGPPMHVGGMAMRHFACVPLLRWWTAHLAHSAGVHWLPACTWPASAVWTPPPAPSLGAVRQFPVCERWQPAHAMRALTRGWRPASMAAVWKQPLWSFWILYWWPHLTYQLVLTGVSLFNRVSLTDTMELVKPLFKSEIV